jgi:hypothetical protein
MIVTAREVQPGPRIDGYRVIRRGLRGDETVVVSGLQRLRADTKVRIQERTLSPVLEAGAKPPSRS